MTRRTANATYSTRGRRRQAFLGWWGRGLWSRRWWLLEKWQSGVGRGAGPRVTLAELHVPRGGGCVRVWCSPFPIHSRMGQSQRVSYESGWAGSAADNKHDTSLREGENTHHGSTLRERDSSTPTTYPALSSMRLLS